MSYIKYLLLLIIIGCSSDPNPLSRGESISIDTLYVTDTLILKDSLSQKDTVEVQSLDTIIKYDTVLNNMQMFDKNQVVNFQIVVSDGGVTSSEKYIVRTNGMVTCLDKDGLDEFDLEKVYINDYSAGVYNSTTGVASFQSRQDCDEIPTEFYVSVQTSLGSVYGIVKAPSQDPMKIFFRNLKDQNGVKYISVGDSLPFAWVDNNSSRYNVQFSYVINRVPTVVDTLVYSPKLTLKKDFFNEYGVGGYITDFKITSNFGKEYGDSEFNLLGNGIGWLSCRYTSSVSTPNIYILPN